MRTDNEVILSLFERALSAHEVKMQRLFRNPPRNLRGNPRAVAIVENFADAALRWASAAVVVERDRLEFR